MNELKIFESSEFGKVRTVLVNDEPFFVGKDVAEVLGYSKPRNAISSHVEKDDALKQGVTDELGRVQEMTLINESGLYSLLFSLARCHVLVSSNIGLRVKSCHLFAVMGCMQWMRCWRIRTCLSMR